MTKNLNIKAKDREQENSYWWQKLPMVRNSTMKAHVDKLEANLVKNRSEMALC